MEEAQAKARQEAGRVAGEYLSEIVETKDTEGNSVIDFMKLTAEQYDIFLQAVIETYRDAMTKACEPF